MHDAPLSMQSRALSDVLVLTVAALYGQQCSLNKGKRAKCIKRVRKKLTVEKPLCLLWIKWLARLQIAEI